MRFLLFLGKVFRKLQEVNGRPLVLGGIVVRFLSGFTRQVCDRMMFAIDRSISLVLIPLYDMFFGRQKKIQSVDVHLCANKHANSAGLVSAESRLMQKTLVEYLGDDSKVSFSNWDEDQFGMGFSFGFYRRMMTLNPKYLILSGYEPGVSYRPEPWILARLKKRNTLLVAFWPDTCNYRFISVISKLIDVIDLHVVFDNPSENYGESDDARLFREKSISNPFPLGFEVEKDEKNIDVVFIGQVSSYRNIRKPYLEFLYENNVNLYSSLSDRNEFFSHEKFHEIMSRAKIGINFSMSTDFPQLKGRIFETMKAGCLLLEQRNDQIATYYSEGEDYEAFSSKEELLEKIEYYLGCEDERKKIAASGKSKTMQLFNENGKTFWAAIFDSLEV